MDDVTSRVPADANTSVRSGRAISYNRCSTKLLSSLSSSMLDGGLIEKVDEEELILDKLVSLLSLSPRFFGFDVDAVDIVRLIEHERMLS
jgi:hypothetical protein